MVTPVGVGVMISHRSGLPRRFDSAAQSWSRRATLMVTPSAANVAVLDQAVTSGDENSSRTSVLKS